MSRNSDRIYLQHILEAIVNIETKIHTTSKEEFDKDVYLQAAIMRFIEIIGEATKLLSPALKNQHPQVAWYQVAGMRNKIIHEYFQVDLDVVWGSIANDVPTLKLQIRERNTL